jgi:hypothetical protein
MQTGELIYHFINTVIVAALVSAAVLWRYRIDVVAGMRVRGEVDLLPSTPLGARVHGDAVDRADVHAWEVRLRRRIVAAVCGVVILCALPIGYAWFAGESDDLLPVQVVARSSGYWLTIVPIAALLLAYSWRQTLTFVVLALLAGAARIVMGRAPTFDQLMNSVNFLQIVALDAPVAATLFIVTGIPRVRGVAPIVFVGLLVFSLAPFLGSQATRLLTTTREGSDLVDDGHGGLRDRVREHQRPVLCTVRSWGGRLMGVRSGISPCGAVGGARAATRATHVAAAARLR